MTNRENSTCDMFLPISEEKSSIRNNNKSELNYQPTENGMRLIYHNYNNKYNNHLKFNSIYEAEQYFKSEYCCYDTYFGTRSTMLSGPLIHFHSIVKDSKLDCISLDDDYNINYVHNKNTVNLIFPHEQIRISGSKSFMNRFPFVKTLIEGDFNKDNIINYSYLNKCKKNSEKEDKEIEIYGSTTIIINNELDSILLNNPVKIRYKFWETKKYWRIEEVFVENLCEIIHFFQEEKYYDDKFWLYDN